MIKKLTNQSALSGVDSPLLPLIYSDFKYSDFSGDGVFECTCNEKTACILSVRNGAATLVKTAEEIDENEISSFFTFRGISHIIADFPFEECTEIFPLLRCNTCLGVYEDTKLFSPFSKFSTYEKAYKLLCNNGDSFDQWFSSFARKINVGDALCAYISDEDVMKSICVVNSIYKSTAVISGVATDSKYRNKGLASQCLKKAAGELYKRGVKTGYLWCEEKTIGFYKNAGFTVCGDIYIK